ncbi:MAG: formylglycine-generating enzyme family protein [Planctomycetes bacterium]|nr:formylglycine-generating enzyme family protein [Planctomycetota bacterium]
MRVEWIIKTISFNLMTFININPQGYKEYRHGGTGLVFVLIPGGTFKMGINDGFNYEKPVHEVTVSDFFIAKYEVTQSVWQKIMGNNPASFKKARQSEEAKDVGSENNPVETVSWDDCQEFCKKAGLRLPTESEWEYAARGKTTTKFYWGDDVKQAGDYAWYQDNSKNTTHPVGQKNPNGFGLYDTAGNVWEYCADWYDETYYKNSPKDNPQGPASGNFKAVRGGCWYDIVTELRVSIRGDAGRSLTGRVGDVGFRPAKTK